MIANKIDKAEKRKNCFHFYSNIWTNGDHKQIFMTFLRFITGRFLANSRQNRNYRKSVEHSRYRNRNSINETHLMKSFMGLGFFGILCIYIYIYLYSCNELYIYIYLFIYMQLHKCHLLNLWKILISLSLLMLQIFRDIKKHIYNYEFLEVIKKKKKI